MLNGTDTGGTIAQLRHGVVQQRYAGDRSSRQMARFSPRFC